MRDAVEKLLQDEAALKDTVFPRGVKVLGIAVHEGEATLDFSQEFNGLTDMGESVESEAQQLLRKTLAVFPEIKTMRVTVEGRPFQSQATDWGKAFPVRDGGSGARTTHAGHVEGANR